MQTLPKAYHQVTCAEQVPEMPALNLSSPRFLQRNVSGISLCYCRHLHFLSHTKHKTFQRPSDTALYQLWKACVTNTSLASAYIRTSPSPYSSILLYDNSINPLYLSYIKHGRFRVYVPVKHVRFQGNDC